jgi:hypothetical protein
VLVGAYATTRSVMPVGVITCPTNPRIDQVIVGAEFAGDTTRDSLGVMQRAPGDWARCADRPNISWADQTRGRGNLARLSRGLDGAAANVSRTASSDRAESRRRAALADRGAECSGSTPRSSSAKPDSPCEHLQLRRAVGTCSVEVGRQRRFTGPDLTAGSRPLPARRSHRGTHDRRSTECERVARLSE